MSARFNLGLAISQTKKWLHITNVSCVALLVITQLNLLLNFGLSSVILCSVSKFIQVSILIHALYKIKSHLKNLKGMSSKVWLLSALAWIFTCYAVCSFLSHLLTSKAKQLEHSQNQVLFHQVWLAQVSFWSFLHVFGILTVALICYTLVKIST